MVWMETITQKIGSFLGTLLNYGRDRLISYMSETEGVTGKQK